LPGSPAEKGQIRILASNNALSGICLFAIKLKTRTEGTSYFSDARDCFLARHLALDDEIVQSGDANIDFVAGLLLQFFDDG
jgi:hypothetical protein